MCGLKNHRVVVFGLDGSFVRQCMGHEWQFNYPEGVVVNGDEVLVADSENTTCKCLVWTARSCGSGAGKVVGQASLIVQQALR